MLAAIYGKPIVLEDVRQYLDALASIGGHSSFR